MTTYTLEEDGRFHPFNGGVRHKLLIDDVLVDFVTYKDGHDYVMRNMKQGDTYVEKYPTRSVSVSYDEMHTEWAHDDEERLGE